MFLIFLLQRRIISWNQNDCKKYLGNIWTKKKVNIGRKLGQKLCSSSSDVSYKFTAKKNHFLKPEWLQEIFGGNLYQEKYRAGPKILWSLPHSDVSYISKYSNIVSYVQVKIELGQKLCSEKGREEGSRVLSVFYTTSLVFYCKEESFHETGTIVRKNWGKFEPRKK